MFNKKVLQQAVKDLDKAKKPAKSKDIIVDPRGQWAFPGEVTRIPSNTITMEGVDYPVLGIPNYGEPKIMMPGQYYEFPEADYVDEYPEFAEGGSAGCPKGFYYNGKECVKLPKGAKVITDPKEYARRKQAYADSLAAFKLTDDRIKGYLKKGAKPGNLILHGKKNLERWTADNKRWLKQFNEGKRREGKIQASRFLEFTNPDEHQLYGTVVYDKPKQPVVLGKKYPEETIPKKIEKEIPVKENVVIDKLPIRQAMIDQPKKDIVRTVPVSNRSDRSAEVYPEYISPGTEDTEVGMEWVNKPERYIDWQGTSIGYRLPRFRKPGHGGDLIKKGKQRYLHLPSIETRNTAELVPEEEEYRHGGIIPKYLKMPKNYGRSKYSSNISATNKVFARNILFRNERNKIFDPNAKYQDGGVSPIEGDLISKVLMNRNRGVDFVDRAYALGDNPGTPLFNVPDDEEFGNHMSHKMAWGTDDQGQAYMFPTVLNPNDEAIKVPNQYADYISSEGYKNATGMNYQDDGEYVELDLTPEEIQEYAKGGYIVEDISVPSLTKAQRGLFKKKDKQDPNKLEYREPVKVEDDLVESVTPFPEAPEDFKKGVANLKEVEAGPYWLGISREYSGKHNKQAYIDKKKRQYLRNTNRGLAKAAGLNMENFPKDVEKNFINEYNYKRNNYVVKNLFKNAGVSPNKREEWVDTINSDDNADVRALIKNSKYGNKLKPSIWARTLAGLGTMASKFSPEIADAMERGDLPGLTREEQRAIKNAKIKGIPVGGIEALAGLDAVGVAVANAVEASGNESYGGDYKKAPGLLSGDVMPKITDDQIAVLNPSTYTVGYDFAPVGKGLLKGVTKIGKASVKAGKAGIKAGKKFGKSISEIDLKPAMGKLQAHFDRPPGPLMLGMSKGAIFDKEIKNPDYFTDLMKINKYSPKQKKYYEGLVNSVKKQGNMASQKQYDELQRLKTGDTNYGKKGYAKGGIVSDLSRKEIDKLVAQGYIIETVD